MFDFSYIANQPTYPTRRSSDLSVRHRSIRTLPIGGRNARGPRAPAERKVGEMEAGDRTAPRGCEEDRDRKSTRLNSSHEWISYAVFCLKKKKKKQSKGYDISNS